MNQIELNYVDDRELNNIFNEINDIKKNAASLKSKSPQNSNHHQIRKEANKLYNDIESVLDEIENIIERKADKIPDVDTEYMVNEGWELSYHDPNDFSDDFVFVCRLYDYISGSYTSINYIFEDKSNFRPDPGEIIHSADNVLYYIEEAISFIEKSDDNI